MKTRSQPLTELLNNPRGRTVVRYSAYRKPISATLVSFGRRPNFIERTSSGRMRLLIGI